MMLAKHLFFSLLILTLPAAMSAQLVAFEKVFGDPGKSAFGVASVTLDDEFIFFLGYESQRGDDTEGTLSKLDLQGNLLWTYEFGTREDDIPRDILLNDQGEIVVIGETQRNGASEINSFVFVFDTSGTQVWAEVYDKDDQNLFFNKIKQTSDGGYIICGYISGEGFGNDYHVVKMDVDGNIEWEQTYGGLNNEIGVAIEILEDGSYVLAGDKQQSDQGPYGIELIGLDPLGLIKWQTDINDFTNGGCKSMILNRAGHLAIVGEAAPPNQLAFDVFLAEVDAQDGQLIWQRFIEASPKSDAGFGIMELPAKDGYMIAGYGFNEGADDTNVMIAQLDPMGNELARRYFENAQLGIGYDIKPVGNASFLISGFATREENPGYFLSLDNCLITTVQEQAEVEVQLFPNPIPSDQQSLQLSVPIQNAKVRIINASGALVSESQHDHLQSIDLPHPAKGAYWIGIQTVDWSIHKKIIRF
ncbi:MAG: T9SS type A sorting domain-containing protein [Bacteroidota bacterium]